MVLKLAMVEGWKFVDRVREASTAEIVAGETELVFSSFNDTILFHHDATGECAVGKEGVYKLFRKGAPSDAGSPSPCPKAFSVLVEMKDGGSRLYLSDLAVYLLSDEGKTIERIN